MVLAVPNTVLAYTCAPTWIQALPVVRIVGPLKHAGLKLVMGNEGETVSIDGISTADVVVIQRDFARNETAMDAIFARARAENKPVLFDLDDLLFEMPAEHREVQSGYFADAFVPMLRAAIEADVVTAATLALCRYLQPFNSNTVLLPNYLDDHLWTIKRPGETRAEGPVLLGYMGTHTHVPDLESILPTLLRILERYRDRVRLKFWGGLCPAELARQPNVEWIPIDMAYPEFAAYFSQQACDVFIAPLVDHLFNRCKSNIKFLEYSALGVGGIYSRIEPYAGVVVHGENGLLAASPEEWEDALAQMIERPELRARLGRKAQETVTGQWLLSKHAQEWVDVYGRAMASPKASAGPEARVVRLVQKLVGEADTGRANKLRAKDELIEAQAEQLRAKDAMIQDQIKTLEDLRAYLQQITNSTGWKWIQRLRRVRAWLAPRESRRERLFQRVARIHRPAP